MNARLDLQGIKTAMKADPAIALLLQVGTCYDRDYLTGFAKQYDKVWLRAQRMVVLTDSSASQLYIQKVKFEMATTLVVQRYLDAETDSEQRLNALHKLITDFLCDYAPAGSFTNFILEAARDGFSNESVMTADIVFSATAIYRKPS